MPKWLRQSLNKASKLANDMADDVVEQVSQQVTEHLGDVELGPALENLKECGSKTHELAKETTELCEQTQQKSVTMISLAAEIQNTLQSFNESGGVDASKLATIRDLLSGDKLQTAMSLAKDMSNDALECVNKSVEMTTVMEDSMEALPEPLQKAIDKAMEDKEGAGATEEQEDELTTLDQDIEDVQQCIASIRKLNLMTAMDVGLDAFQQLTQKAQVTRGMLEDMQGFSSNVRDTTGAFRDLDVVNIMKSIKELWKCLRLTGMMRQMAEGLGKLLQIVIDLFQETSTRISGLWKALAFAKDCMGDVTEQVNSAKALCGMAQEKSVTLIDTTRSIKDELEDMGELNASSVSAFKELSDGEEIRSAISIAQEMDDRVLQCVEKVVGMIDRVSEGVKNLPPIVTEGIPEDAGKREDDPEPPEVEDDIQDLEQSREAIENANIVLAVKEGARGFSGVSDKVGICKDMLGVLQGFADSCLAAIESFMGVWDLKTAVEKIKEMFRIVNLGELMKKFANQIKRLILAAIALMKAAVEKFGNMDLSDLAGNLKESLGGAMDKAEDLVDDLNLKKLRFWKK